MGGGFRDCENKKSRKSKHLRVVLRLLPPRPGMGKWKKTKQLNIRPTVYDVSATVDESDIKSQLLLVCIF